MVKEPVQEAFNAKPQTKPLVVADMKTAVGIALILILAAASSLVMVKTASASIPKPSVPEFTASYVDYSYDIPSTYRIDEFSGRNMSNNNGYHVDQQSVLFKIRNQPFTSYNDSNGNVINRYFNFRYRGHFGTDWRYYPFSEAGGGTVRYGSTFYSFTDERPQISQSTSDYTEKSFTLAFLFSENKPTIGSPVDFQMQAIEGHIDYAGDGYYSFVGTAGDWSPMETLTIGTNELTITTSPNPIPHDSNDTIQPTLTPAPTLNPTTAEPIIDPTETPSQPDTQANVFSGVYWKDIALAAACGIIAVLAVALVLSRRKRA